MYNAVVLHVGVLAYGDGVAVASDHGARPNAGIFTYNDVPNDIGHFAHEGGGMDVGRLTSQTADHLFLHFDSMFNQRLCPDRRLLFKSPKLRE